MADVPLKPLAPADADLPCPAYAEDASSAAAAESTPFISLSERDVEAATAPPAYAHSQNLELGLGGEAEEEETGKDDPFKNTPWPARVLLWMLSALMVAVAFAAILTMMIGFLKLLLLVWRKMGLIG
ncbi:hypothetical protein F4781DRAFT_252950 [Annulohypoxylon bovei var. microspora]|nr:hypothetical protein F4781DRAFT_252950 [Annulohypoxylon bovei var. microspora]